MKSKIQSNINETDQNQYLQRDKKAHIYQPIAFSPFSLPSIRSALLLVPELHIGFIIHKKKMLRCFYICFIVCISSISFARLLGSEDTLSRVSYKDAEDGVEKEVLVHGDVGNNNPRPRRHHPLSFLDDGVSELNSDGDENEFHLRDFPEVNPQEQFAHVTRLLTMSLPKTGLNESCNNKLCAYLQVHY